MPESTQKTTLQEISIQGYKSCSNTDFLPNSCLSVLIGINGAGKTNVLNAINLLSPQDLRRYVTGRSVDPPVAKTSVIAWFLDDGKRIGLRLTLFFSSLGRSEAEVLDFREEWNFGAISKSKKWVDLPATLIFGIHPSFLWVADAGYKSRPPQWK